MIERLLAIFLGLVFVGLFLYTTINVTMKLGWQFAVLSALWLVIIFIVVKYAETIVLVTKKDMLLEMIDSGYLSMVRFKDSELTTSEIEIGRKALDGDIPSLLLLMRMRAINFWDFDRLQLDVNFHLGKHCIQSAKGYEKYFQFTDSEFDNWDSLPSNGNETIH